MSFVQSSSMASRAIVRCRNLILDHVNTRFLSSSSLWTCQHNVFVSEIEPRGRFLEQSNGDSKCEMEQYNVNLIRKDLHGLGNGFLHSPAHCGIRRNRSGLSLGARCLQESLQTASTAMEASPEEVHQAVEALSCAKVVAKAKHIQESLTQSVHAVASLSRADLTSKIKHQNDEYFCTLKHDFLKTKLISARVPSRLNLEPCCEKSLSRREKRDMRQTMPRALLIVSRDFTTCGKLKEVAESADEVVDRAEAVLTSEDSVSERTLKLETLYKMEDKKKVEKGKEVNEDKTKVKEPEAAQEDLALREMAVATSREELRKAKEHEKEKLSNISHPLAMIKSASSRNRERQDFMSLLKKKIETYNPLLEKEGAETDIAYMSAREEFDHHAEAAAQGKFLSVQIQKADALFDQELENIAENAVAQIGGCWQMLDKHHADSEVMLHTQNPALSLRQRSTMGLSVYQVAPKLALSSGSRQTAGVHTMVPKPSSTAKIDELISMLFERISVLLYRRVVLHGLNMLTHCTDWRVQLKENEVLSRAFHRRKGGYGVGNDPYTFLLFYRNSSYHRLERSCDPKTKKELYTVAMFQDILDFVFPELLTELQSAL